MPSALAVKSSAIRAEIGSTRVFSVAISAAPIQRSSIEHLAMHAGARIVADHARFDVLLLAIDSAASVSSSVVAISSMAPVQTKVCIIWCDGVPGSTLISQLLRAGAAGVVSIDISPAKLKAVLTAIHDGLQVIDPALRGASDLQERANSSQEELTHRENEVLKMMGEGLSNKEISARLAISTHTVKFHISSILGKLGAASRTEAVSIGVKSGRLTI